MKNSVRAGVAAGVVLIGGSIAVVMNIPPEPPAAQPVRIASIPAAAAPTTEASTLTATAAVVQIAPARRPAVNPPDPNCTADDLDRSIRYSKEEGYGYLAARDSSGCHTIHAWMKDALAGVPDAGDVAVWLCTHDFNSPLVNANHRIEVDVREADLWADAVCLNFDYKSTHYMQCRPIFKSPTRQVLNFEDFPCTKETTLTLGETKTVRAAAP